MAERRSRSGSARRKPVISVLAPYLPPVSAQLPASVFEPSLFVLPPVIACDLVPCPAVWLVCRLPLSTSGRGITARPTCRPVCTILLSSVSNNLSQDSISSLHIWNAATVGRALTVPPPRAVWVMLISASSGHDSSGRFGARLWSDSWLRVDSHMSPGF
jgi:hypothetical protein